MEHEISQEPATRDDRLLLHALADAELDAATALRLERRMSADPGLAAEYVRILAVKDAMARAREDAVPEDFAAKIAALAAPKDSAATRAAAPSGRWFSAPGWLSMAASVVIAAGVASGVTYTTMTARFASSLEDSIVSSHRRALLASTPIDVASSDRHTVRPWFDAKLGVAPPTPDLAADGFTLIGGRVDVIADKPVPALVYRHREHLITVVALPINKSAPLELPVADTDAGYNVVHWTGDSFQYWAVSDLEAKDLKTFVDDLRRQ